MVLLYNIVQVFDMSNLYLFSSEASFIPSLYSSSIGTAFIYVYDSRFTIVSNSFIQELLSRTFHFSFG
jgi:hypothetical protein